MNIREYTDAAGKSITQILAGAPGATKVVAEFNDAGASFPQGIDQGVAAPHNVTTLNASVSATAPLGVFTTSVTSPAIIGGTAVGADLTLQSTSGIGDGTDTVIVKVGNNGATTVATFGAASLALVGAFSATLGVQFASVARTATADGTGTGAIAAGTSYVTAANGGDANNWLTLPAPTPGTVIWIYCTGNMELRSSDPATIAINGGAGAGAESALASGVLHRLVCTTATTWVGSTFAANGTEAALEAAA